MNKYKVIWGGSFVGSNNKFDGFATIEGETFEDARQKFYLRELEKGFRMGLIEPEPTIVFCDTFKFIHDLDSYYGFINRMKKVKTYERWIY